jgi:hypothetical protein
MALANILPSDLIHLHDLFESREALKAQALQAALVDINQAVTKDYGIPGKFGSDFLKVRSQSCYEYFTSSWWHS